MCWLWIMVGCLLGMCGCVVGADRARGEGEETAAEAASAAPGGASDLIGGVRPAGRSLCNSITGLEGLARGVSGVGDQLGEELGEIRFE